MLCPHFKCYKYCSDHADGQLVWKIPVGVLHRALGGRSDGWHLLAIVRVGMHILTSSNSLLSEGVWWGLESAGLMCRLHAVNNAPSVINLPDIFPETLQPSIGICLRDMKNKQQAIIFKGMAAPRKGGIGSLWWASGEGLVWCGYVMVGRWPSAGSCALNAAIHDCEGSMLGKSFSNFRLFRIVFKESLEIV